MKQLSFHKIRQALQQIDAEMGLFLIKRSSDHRTKLERFFAFVFPIKVFLVFFMIFSTMEYTHYELLSCIFCGSLLTIYILLYVTLTKFTMQKESLNDLIRWCEGLYKIEEKFDKRVQETAYSHLVPMEKLALFIVVALKWGLNMTSTSITYGFAFIGLFLPEDLYPKFSPPIPFYLPFKEQKTWFAFITTVFVQGTVGLHAAAVTIFIFGVFYGVIIHILGYLDMVKEIVVHIKEEILEENKKKGLHQASIDNQWFKIITDMISDVNSAISTLNNLYSEFFLLLEIASLAALFITGLIVTVVKRQYFITFLSCYNVLFFTVCYIHEQILKKINNIKMELYDMPWYQLNGKQRTMLFMVMKCDQAQSGLAAAGIHTLTIERFGMILKAGYTNLLVLKDLVAG